MWVRLPPSAPAALWSQDEYDVGAWLSLVERSVRVAEVGGSNPLAPTTSTTRPVDQLLIGGPAYSGDLLRFRALDSAGYGC